MYCISLIFSLSHENVFGLGEYNYISRHSAPMDVTWILSVFSVATCLAYTWNSTGIRGSIFWALLKAGDVSGCLSHSPVLRSSNLYRGAIRSTNKAPNQEVTRISFKSGPLISSQRSHSGAFCNFCCGPAIQLATWTSAVVVWLCAISSLGRSPSEF
jgi:hypothetical protein